jgi:hypothetical protein
MLFKEVITVYSENDINPKNVKYGLIYLLGSRVSSGSIVSD